MTPQRRSDLDSFVLHEVHRRADIVDRTQLQHEVMQPLGRRNRNQRERVMARVAMEEHHGDLRRPQLHVDGVADSKTEALAIEAQTLLDIRDRDYDVPDALCASDETSNRARRMERVFELYRRAAEDIA